MPGTLSNGAGIAAFTYNGTANANVAIDFASVNTWTGTQTFSAAGNGIVVTNNADFQGNVANSGGDFTVADNVVPSADNNYDLGTNALRWNDLFLGGNIYVNGNIENPTGNVTINDNLDVNNNLNVTQTSTLNGAVTANNGVTVTTGGVTINNGGLTVNSGGASITGGATINTGNLTVSVGNFSVAGTSDLQGNIFNSSGDVTFNDNIRVNNGSGDVKLSYGVQNAAGNNYTLPNGYSVIYINGFNDGNIDNATPPAGGINGMILYVVYYNQGGDAVSFDGGLTTYNVGPTNYAAFTLVYASGSWHVVSYNYY